MAITTKGTMPATETGAMAYDATAHNESVDGVDALHVEQRYGEERAKRLREEANDQFVEPSLSSGFQHFLDDPWADLTEIKEMKSMFPDNSCRMLIVGAGLGGLLYAVRMVEAGVSPQDLRIIDVAGGWGGTWYWNRYPGLMCDIESYCYLPLLEETGYVPKHRYSYGEEIRNYANLVAEKWGINDSTVFQTRAKKLAWDETAKVWQVELLQHRTGQLPQELNVRSQFVVMVNGVLNWPKLPKIPGLLDYKGTTFHTSRWNYGFTGGSPEDPSLSNLQNKRVAIVGTGCTAVQVVPEVARWAKHLYVIQRTPASVDRRDQRKTDIAWFRNEVADIPNWQRERHRNFHQHFTTEKPPAVNLVDDQWTRALGMVVIAGNKAGPQTMEELPEYLKLLHSLDLPRLNRLRERVKEEVHDPKVAESLQPWYPTWCKRPAFHDEYLRTYNRANVTLIDTAGKGPDQITGDAVVVNGQTYPVDALIFATGFRAPYVGTPAGKANLTILGRGGVSMAEEWDRDGPSTLHGVLDTNFPNMFLSGPWQASTSPNFVFNDDCLAKHCAYIFAEASRRAGGNTFVVSSTAEAAKDWSVQVAMHAAPMAAIIGCTPSYFNMETALDRVPPEHQFKLASSGLWGHGIEDFLPRIETWRAEGGMKGIEVHT